MHDQKRFGFIYKDGASLKKMSEEKEQLTFKLAFNTRRLSPKTNFNTVT